MQMLCKMTVWSNIFSLSLISAPASKQHVYTQVTAPSSDHGNYDRSKCCTKANNIQLMGKSSCLVVVGDQLVLSFRDYWSDHNLY